MDIKKYFSIYVDMEYYGKVCFRCIGIYNITALIQNNLYLEVDEKYFPFQYFSSTLCCEVLEYSEKHNDEIAWAILLPFKEDNKNWEPEQHNSYYEYWKQGKKSLPIAIGNKNDLKKILKWQQGGMGMFTPDYLDNIKTLEELKHKFNIF